MCSIRRYISARFFLEADYSNAILVIDEAHNLVQRAMDYYSPSLSRQHIRDLSGNLRHVEPSLAKELRKFLGEIDDFFRSQVRTKGDEYTTARRERRGPGQVPDTIAARILRGTQADLQQADRPLPVGQDNQRTGDP